MRLKSSLLPAGALLALLGCNSAPRDGGKVLANVAGEKITESDFRQILEATGAPAAQIQDFLAKPEARDHRAQFLNQVAMSKALIVQGKREGLDQDLKVRQAIEQATAKVYFQTMLEQRLGKLGKIEPTEAQLKAFYEKKLAERIAAGQTQGLPKFDDVKAQLTQLWRQEKTEEAQNAIMGELKEKVAITIADEWKVVKP